MSANKDGVASWIALRRRSAMRTAAVLLVAALPAFANGQDEERRSGPEKEPEKLGERLIREAADGSEEDPMGTMLRLMDEAARNLEIEFDAGPDTQQVQARIVEELDKAIKLAAAHSRRARSRTSGWTGEKRTREQQRRQEAGEGQAGTEAEAGAASDHAAAAAATASADTAPEPGQAALREVRRSWGLLPQREREEIIQGSEEQFLERYREWIERYYQALQEAPQ